MESLMVRKSWLFRSMERSIHGTKIEIAMMT
jgi:hypothetical protein